MHIEIDTTHRLEVPIGSATRAPKSLISGAQPVARRNRSSHGHRPPRNRDSAEEHAIHDHDNLAMRGASHRYFRADQTGVRSHHAVTPGRQAQKSARGSPCTRSLGSSHLAGGRRRPGRFVRRGSRHEHKGCAPGLSNVDSRTCAVPAVHRNAGLTPATPAPCFSPEAGSGPAGIHGAGEKTVASPRSLSPRCERPSAGPARACCGRRAVAGVPMP